MAASQINGVLISSLSAIDGISSISSVNGVSVSIGGGSSYSDLILAESPVAYWKLDEGSGTTIFDSAGSYDATISGTYTLGASGMVSGEIDTAIVLSSTDGLIKLSSGGPNVQGGSFTYMALIKTTETDGYFLNEGNASDEFSGITLVGGSVRFFNSISGAFATSAGTINDGSMHHVAFTYNGGTGAAKIYIDGSLDGTATGSSSAGTMPKVGIGALVRSSDGTTVPGTYQHVALFNTELNGATISDLSDKAHGI